MAGGKWRLAMAGAGNISQFHLTAWTRRPDVEVVAICDPDPARARDRAARFGIPSTFADFDTMLAHARADIVDIASPMHTHARCVRAAIASGAHAMCQKPLCGTLAEAQDLVSSLPPAPRLMVHENWRFRPWYRTMARWLAERRVGNVQTVRLSWRNSGLLPDEQGQLPIFARQPYMALLPRLMVGEVLIHHLDTLRFLFGALRIRSATLAHECPQASGESAATIDISGRHGEVITLEGDMCAVGHPARPLDRCEITGDAGRILLEGGVLSLQASHAESETFDLDAAYQASFDATIAHFTDRLARGEEFETGPHDNLETLALVDEVYAIANRRA
jgi:predicted dehydrogenase